MTYRRKHETGENVVSPHRSNPNQSSNEGSTCGSCSNNVEDKYDIGSVLYSVYAVFDCRWPAQICKFYARFELVLDNGSQVKVKERSLVGAVGDVFGRLGGQILLI